MLFSNKTFVLSGANGWLGKSVLDYISGSAERYQTKFIDCNVIALVYNLESTINFSSNYDNLNLTCLEVDLINPDFRLLESALFNRDKNDIIFIHSAGLVHPKLFCKEWKSINELGSRNFFKIANHFSSHVVVISSNSPFGTNKDDRPFDEETEYNPFLGYGRSKWRMELLALNEISSPKLTILRPPWFYGPNQPVRQAKFYEMIRKGHFPIFGNKIFRSKAHVYNIAHAIFCSILNQRQQVLKLWIADNRPYNMKEISEIVSKAWVRKGKKVQIRGYVQLPSAISELFYICDYILQIFGLYNTSVHVLGELNKSIFCKIDGAKNLINYDPLYSLDDSIDELI